MIPSELYRLWDSVLAEVHPNHGGLNDEDLQKIRHFLPDPLLLAALDIVDRERVVRLTLPGGRTLYEVHGSMSTYMVYSRLPHHLPVYCSCPSFTFSVLSSEDYMVVLDEQCKHVAAVDLAQRLNRVVDRPVSDDDFANFIFQIL